ncbi:unnamed protein product [Arabidopsis arenosa]|uniref:Uncharacterized protein n=1 Tax=Arabidopsis arenosa TaxID=38785 RepID=A0A8S2B8K3_ARAAE|nr:unnamed protein product [Arabidopsis arenosa]
MYRFRFSKDNGKLTRKITKCFTNKFDGPYYSWSCVPSGKKERYFLEFASDGTSRRSKLSQEEDDEIFLQSTVTNDRREYFGVGSLRIYINGKQREVEALRVAAKQAAEIKHLTMVKKYLSETDTSFLAFLNSQSTLRMIIQKFSKDNGKLTRKITKCFTNKFDGPYYSWSCVPSGKKERYFLEFAEVELGRPPTIGEVFIRTHTKKDGTFVDRTSTVTNDRGEYFGVGSLRVYINGKSKYPQSTSSFTTLQSQLKDANCKIEEQVALQAEREVEAMRVAAKQADEIKHLMMVKKFSKDNGKLTRKITKCFTNKFDGPYYSWSCVPSGKKERYFLEFAEVELGRPPTIGEVFIRTHTKKDGTFVDRTVQEIHEAYLKNKAAKLADLHENDEYLLLSYYCFDHLLRTNVFTFLTQSTVTNDRGEYFGVGSLRVYINGKRKYPQSTSSFTTLQSQLKDANCKIEEQVALQAEREVEAMRVAAKQADEIKHLMMVKKYLSETDPNFLAFLKSQSTLRMIIQRSKLQVLLLILTYDNS